MRPSCSNNHVFSDRSFLSCRSGNQCTVAATRGDRSLLVYRAQDKLNHHFAATHRSDKSLRLYRRIFVKIFVSTTEFCWCNMTQKNQIRHNLCDLWRQQNYVAETKIFTNIFQYTNDFLLQLVARPVHKRRRFCCCKVLLQLVPWCVVWVVDKYGYSRIHVATVHHLCLSTQGP